MYTGKITVTLEFSVEADTEEEYEKKKGEILHKLEHFGNVSLENEDFDDDDGIKF